MDLNKVDISRLPSDVKKDFLKHLIDRFKNDDKLGAIQPLICQMNNPDKIWNSGGKFLRLIGLPVVIGKGKILPFVNRISDKTE